MLNIRMLKINNKLIGTLLGALALLGCMTANANPSYVVVTPPPGASPPPSVVVSSANPPPSVVVTPSRTNNPPSYVVVSPPPKEIIVVPQGAIHCNYVRAGVHHHKYTEAYRVCFARQGHVQWVSGHWECPKYNSWQGTCKKWVWVPSFWIRQ